MSTAKKILIVLLGAALVTSAFANGTREASSDDPMELNIIHNMLVETEGGAAEAFRGAVERVQAAYPDLVISEEALAATAYHTKITIMAAAGEVPDVFIIRGSMLDTLIENDLVQPIDADLAADPAWRDGFLPGAFDVFTRGESIYGIPLSAKATSLVFYNRDIFREVGIEDFPTTAEAFTDAVVRLRDAGYTPIALGNQDKWVVNSCILSTLGDRFTG
ncbi:MAG: extracellular solute-binding protein, partial [Spirochaetales bacterium]|nr:extracellular solute-binding protein [Spirochaetales bacterium]